MTDANQEFDVLSKLVDATYALMDWIVVRKSMAYVHGEEAAIVDQLVLDAQAKYNAAFKLFTDAQEELYGNVAP